MVTLEAGKRYVTADGTPVLCQGRDAQYPANWRMTILLYPCPLPFRDYLVFDDGTDTWRQPGLAVVAPVGGPRHCVSYNLLWTN